jgi:hypothetical protein
MFQTWTYLDLCTADELSLHWFGSSEDEEGKGGEDWRRLISRAADEDAGAVLRIRPTVTVARKPL